MKPESSIAGFAVAPLLGHPDPALQSLQMLADEHVPLAEAWLTAIAELRKGNVKPFFALPSYEWQTLEERIPEVAELLRIHAPRLA